jgi:two-component system cell cycle sensor histidine kinase/response regulator CckA
MQPKTLDNLFFKTAVHQCNDFVIITDAEALIVYVNPSFEKHTGYKLKNIKGKNISIIKSNLHNNTFYKKLWADINKGRPVSKVFINKKRVVNYIMSIKQLHQ